LKEGEGILDNIKETQKKEGFYSETLKHDDRTGRKIVVGQREI